MKTPNSWVITNKLCVQICINYNVTFQQSAFRVSGGLSRSVVKRITKLIDNIIRSYCTFRIFFVRLHTTHKFALPLREFYFLIQRFTADSLRFHRSRQSTAVPDNLNVDVLRESQLKRLSEETFVCKTKGCLRFHMTHDHVLLRLDTSTTLNFWAGHVIVVSSATQMAVHSIHSFRQNRKPRVTRGFNVFGIQTENVQDRVMDSRTNLNV